MNKQFHFRARVALSLVASLTTLSFVNQAAAHGQKLPKQFLTKLAGAAEVGVQGDPDGAAIARVNVKQEAGKAARVCLTVDALKIAKVVKVHLHNAAADANGPVVVDYPVNDTLVRVSGKGLVTRIAGCLDVADDLATAIRSNSSAYYVNVHTEEFPKGAIRGQLPALTKKSAAAHETAQSPSPATDAAHNHTDATSNGKTDQGYNYNY